LSSSKEWSSHRDLLAATDGSSAARIEEEIHVTADGPRLLTKFLAQELLVTGTRYWNGFFYAHGANEIRRQ
jgi:hypothetical protein